MFEQLLSPMRIGTLDLKNRMVCSAAVTRLANPDGTVTEGFIRYHEDKAKGGWGLTMTEDIPVLETCRTYERLPGLWDDSQIESHRELTRRVHAAGGRIGAQIYHAGRVAASAVNGVPNVGPSAVSGQGLAQIPRELSVEEIGGIVKAFGQAARRAKEAGYDLVELHGAHGYLIHQFLSGNSNKRHDAYGGSLKNRNRFLMEIIAEVRKAAGGDFPVVLRLSVVDYLDGGTNLAESLVTARMAEAAGVNAISCSAGTYGVNHAIIPPSDTPRGLYVDNAAAIKSGVSIPVMATGRINDPYLADAVIASGKADFVTMLRASLADPELPNKIAEGRVDEIVYCIGCLQGCLGANRRGEPFSCMVRPLTGRAHEVDLSPVERAKKVVVVGGGVAGCEAAIYAAMRGHRVSLYEKESRLGGRWFGAGVTPGKSEYLSFLYWQSVMLEKYGVGVHLSHPLSAEEIAAMEPDEVLLAAGAADFIPPIPGVDGSSVVKAMDVLTEKVKAGQRVVVIGGGLVGAETASYLAEYGTRKVTILETKPQIVADGEPNPNRFLLEKLERNHVEVYVNVSITEITDQEVVFTHEGREVTIPQDTVVLSTGLRADGALQRELEARGCHVTAIGDARRGKNGLHNIYEGFMTGATI